MKILKRLRNLMLLLLIPITALSLKIVLPDTMITMPCYKSYYAKSIEAPAFVIYKLYRGGGSNSRTNMRFKSTLPHFNYTGSGYDIGHMCNAEDFAYNYKLEESTFRYYNALPQTPNLNRGIWKVNESQVRALSQSDSLLICCGGCDFNNLIPTRCFKVVYSLSTHALIYSFVFTNTNKATKQYSDLIANTFTFEEVYKLWSAKSIHHN